MLLTPIACKYPKMNDQDLVLETSLNESCKQFSLLPSKSFSLGCILSHVPERDWKLQANNGDLIRVTREILPPEIELEGCPGLYLHILASTLCNAVAWLTTVSFCSTGGGNDYDTFAMLELCEYFEHHMSLSV